MGLTFPELAIRCEFDFYGILDKRPPLIFQLSSDYIDDQLIASETFKSSLRLTSSEAFNDYPIRREHRQQIGYAGFIKDENGDYLCAGDREMYQEKIDFLSIEKDEGTYTRTVNSRWVFDSVACNWVEEVDPVVITGSNPLSSGSGKTTITHDYTTTKQETITERDGYRKIERVSLHNIVPSGSYPFTPCAEQNLMFQTSLHGQKRFTDPSALTVRYNVTHYEEEGVVQSEGFNYERTTSIDSNVENVTITPHHLVLRRKVYDLFMLTGVSLSSESSSEGAPFDPIVYPWHGLNGMFKDIEQSKEDIGGEPWIRGLSSFWDRDGDFGPGKFVDGSGEFVDGSLCVGFKAVDLINCRWRVKATAYMMSYERFEEQLIVEEDLEIIVEPSSSGYLNFEFDPPPEGHDIWYISITINELEKEVNGQWVDHDIDNKCDVALFTRLGMLIGVGIEGDDGIRYACFKEVYTDTRVYHDHCGLNEEVTHVETVIYNSYTSYGYAPSDAGGKDVERTYVSTGFGQVADRVGTSTFEIANPGDVITARAPSNGTHESVRIVDYRGITLRGDTQGTIDDAYWEEFD